MACETHKMACDHPVTVHCSHKLRGQQDLGEGVALQQQWPLADPQHKQQKLGENTADTWACSAPAVMAGGLLSVAALL